MVPQVSEVSEVCPQTAEHTKASLGKSQMTRASPQTAELTKVSLGKGFTLAGGAKVRKQVALGIGSKYLERETAAVVPRML